MRTHQELDDRSLALHRLIADKIRHDPALFDKARATLDHWRQRVSIRTQPCLDEWAHLMDQGIDACLAVAVEDSERATALRQSSPFSGLLSNQDRFAFLKAWPKGIDHAAH
ncbi:MAG: hypothetical protein Q7V20_02520 [Aquabacterium sp.]|uniref:hypothetical protein n=1 Tax=Aquabacterium sp. TaxID=1872578 RepID=UPI00272807D3|nr:hypothetical protein [Aquabacterium sp.]MDO9002312.1 hypothetical protein [Aquabacterium sp.]